MFANEILDTIFEMCLLFCMAGMFVKYQVLKCVLKNVHGHIRLMKNEKNSDEITIGVAFDNTKPADLLPGRKIILEVEQEEKICTNFQKKN